MRAFDGISTIDIDTNVNKHIDDVANWLSSTYSSIGDKDKTCGGTDDLLFYEGTYCTKKTVGSIPTMAWNTDYNNCLYVILFLKPIS